MPKFGVVLPWLVCVAGILHAQANSPTVAKPGPAVPAPLNPAQTGTAQPPAAPDPLAAPKQALLHEDYANARALLQPMLQQSPASKEILFLMGRAELGLRHLDAAEQDFRKVLAQDAKLWPAHAFLLLVYAEAERWPQFDAEHATLAAARASHDPGLPAVSVNMIDSFQVNGQAVVAMEFSPPQGEFHMKYSFTWLGKNGKPAGSITCESDDVDQAFFERKHPKEAAAGQRSYSLDAYLPGEPQPDGDRPQTHATLRFYEDGEPTYEQVRKDAIAYLQSQASRLRPPVTAQAR